MLQFIFSHAMQWYLLINAPINVNFVTIYQTGISSFKIIKKCKKCNHLPSVS